MSWHSALSHFIKSPREPDPTWEDVARRFGEALAEEVNGETAPADCTPREWLTYAICQFQATVAQQVLEGALRSCQRTPGCPRVAAHPHLCDGNCPP